MEYSKKIIGSYMSSKKNRVNKLQLGCWPNVFDGWLNTDVNTEESKEVAILDLL